MSDSIIQVKNLGKSYILSHEGRESYTALRDVITQKARKLFSFPSSCGAKKESASSKEEFWALKDVNFEIQQGDRVGIIGRNGAGKSTLLKILSRITEPTTGQIKIKGRVASLLEVGTGFHPELTGRENIFLNGAILGMSRVEIKKKFDEIVDFAEVEKFLDTPVKRYSSGMYVRLAFAVAAHMEPEILIVDEVLAVGDVQFQKKCLGKMENVSKGEGRTVIFVSHNMSAISGLCNIGLLLSQGQVVRNGKIDAVIGAYVNRDKNYQNAAIENIAGLKWWITGITLYQEHRITSHINTSSPISFNIKFTGKENRKISFELLIKDNNQNPVLFIPFGSGQNINFNCAPGKYSLDFEIKLPHLATGAYTMDVFIVESLIQRLSVFQDAFSFQVISNYIEATGWNFEKSQELGNIMGEINSYNFNQIKI